MVNRQSGKNLRLRSISDILSERFFVPFYQRGYRWEPRQVEALLDDLATFQLESRQVGVGTYYCLQPVVVRQRPEGDWELIDGQQRLTTILLIFKALEAIASIFNKRCYEITYDTRPESGEFLKKLSRDQAEKYVDFHYMYLAHEAIEKWFAGRDGGLRLRLFECLTSPDGAAPNVRVIWYELDSSEDPIEIFVRLNVGRIPLKSAELIRAQLLRGDRNLAVRDAQQIAQDWDLIENRLQDDRYWYFLQSDPVTPPTRIEFLFDIFVRAQLPESERAPVSDPLATFIEFQQLLDKPNTQAWVLWREFKQLAQVLDDWFEDRTLFHLIGFLIETSGSEATGRGARRLGDAKLLVELFRARSTCTVSAFDKHLRRLIWRRFSGPRSADPPVEGWTRDILQQRIIERLDALDYGSAAVRTALLLFNIAGLLAEKGSTNRFQFESYKTSQWDIEHVRSVAEYMPGAAADRKRWLERAKEFAESAAAVARDKPKANLLTSKIADLLSQSSPEEQGFIDVFAGIRELSGEAQAREGDSAISNLVLLDVGTNRSYKNAIFPVKRSRIIDLDKRGQFVPPATRNVFLKYFSPNASQLLLWDEADQDAYRRAIEETLLDFFTPLEIKEAIN